MTRDQSAAYVNALTAIFNARIAGMVAENQFRTNCGNQIAYDSIAFEKEIEEFGLHHNNLIGLFNQCID